MFTRETIKYVLGYMYTYTYIYTYMCKYKFMLSGILSDTNDAMEREKLF